MFIVKWSIEMCGLWVDLRLLAGNKAFKATSEGYGRMFDNSVITWAITETSSNTMAHSIPNGTRMESIDPNRFKNSWSEPKVAR